MRLYRIVKTKHLSTAWSGTGAQLYGGRWNPPGKPVVYLATSISLAILEIMVHLQSSLLLQSYTLLSIDIPDEKLEQLNLVNLSEDWKDPSPPDSTQNLGEAWLQSASSVGLRVPSVIVPSEFNVIVNPLHPDFAPLLASVEKQPMAFDPRLI
ncbi:MAG: RES domain-containing protein [Ewingella sp.]|nr:RES domain-containing protein [Ewingella sp.]